MDDLAEIVILSILSYMLLKSSFFVINSTANLELKSSFANHHQGWHGTFQCIKNLTGRSTCFEAITNDQLSIPWDEVAVGSFFGIILSFIGSFAWKHNLINRLGKFLRVTKRWSDEDVWHYFHNLQGQQWVFVRDQKRNLCYYGYIQAFSESGDDRELLLQDVDVYTNDDVEFLYKVKALYLSGDKHAFFMEIPELPGEEQGESDGKKDG